MLDDPLFPRRELASRSWTYSAKVDSISESDTSSVRSASESSQANLRDDDSALSCFPVSPEGASDPTTKSGLLDLDLSATAELNDVQSQGVEVRQREARERGSSGRLSWLVATSTILLASWLIGPLLIERFYYARTRGEMLAQYDVAKTALSSDPLRDLSNASQWVFQKVKPSVVHIRTATKADGDVLGREIRSPFTEGQGSGVIVTSDGYILTNEHVIQDASEIWVTLYDRRSYLAEVVGLDTQTDLAVIKIAATQLIPAEWGRSDDLRVGSLVWAIGSPYGLEQSTTQGIVSALHRKKKESLTEGLHQDLLQCDAAVNPGNSGGPLINERGEVVGINTSIVGEAFCGISFAVPSDVAREVFTRLRTSGRVDRGFLGVVPQVVPGGLVSKFDIKDGAGAFVQHVEPGSAADRAGLLAGDVILSWNDQTVANDISLFRLVGLTPIDSVADVDILRNGRPMALAVQLDRRPD